MAMPAWVAEIGVVAQVAIVSLAVWGEKLRAAITRPRLSLTLIGGLQTERREISDLGVVAVRYSRLELRNLRPFSVANEVQVFLIKLENQEPSGQTTTWNGAVPLEWQHGVLYQAARNIGSSTVAVANLLFTYADFSELTSMVKPVPVDLDDRKLGEQHYWLTAVARGVNAESAPLRVELHWDGRTDDHLSVRAVP
jgi:hypothetical protein